MAHKTPSRHDVLTYAQKDALRHMLAVHPVFKIQLVRTLGRTKRFAALSEYVRAYREDWLHAEHFLAQTVLYLCGAERMDAEHNASQSVDGYVKLPWHHIWSCKPDMTLNVTVWHWDSASQEGNFYFRNPAYQRPMRDILQFLCEHVPSAVNESHAAVVRGFDASAA